VCATKWILSNFYTFRNSSFKIIFKFDAVHVKIRTKHLCRVSRVGIDTLYGMDDPGIKSEGGEIFRTSPDRPWNPHSLLYHRCTCLFPGVMRQGHDFDHSPSSKSEVKERFELQLCYRSGPSRPVLGRNLLILHVEHQ
jgi:hypothetical protein